MISQEIYKVQKGSINHCDAVGQINSIGLSFIPDKFPYEKKIRLLDAKTWEFVKDFQAVERNGSFYTLIRSDGTGESICEFDDGRRPIKFLMYQV